MPGVNGVREVQFLMADPSVLDDLVQSVHRLELKLDTALTQTQARLDEQGRQMASIVIDVREVKSQQREADLQRTSVMTRVDSIERLTAVLTERKPPQWPIVLAAVVAAVALLLNIASVIYGQPL